MTDKGLHCPFQESQRLANTCKAISAACPLLEEVEIDCACGDSSEMGEIWTLIPSLQALRHVMICDNPPDAVLPKLRMLESVKIAATNGLQLATSFCCQLTCLFLVYDGALDAQQIASLGNFPRLKSLKFYISAGADSALPDTLRAFPFLEDLIRDVV